MLIEVSYKKEVVLRVDTDTNCSDWIKNQMKMYKQIRKKDSNLKIRQLKEKNAEWLKMEKEWEILKEHLEE